MKILVGYDGSSVAKSAMAVAREHAKAFNAKVHVVTSMVSGSEQRQKAIDNAESELEWAGSFFREEGIACETHLLIRGMEPGEDLVNFVQEKDIDVVVVGVKKQSKVEKILLGSTAQYVIIKAPCIVVTVK